MAETGEIVCRWQDREVTIGWESSGAGPDLLLLPALSSISTREEMRPLQEGLAPAFRVTAIDWPGFGDRARPKLSWTPDMLSAFLAHILSLAASPPYAIVAAGHAATYALHHLVHHPGAAERLVLLAPTWRGPLPTMASARKPWFSRLVTAVDAPLIGPLIYRLNVSRFVVEKMAFGHVYRDPGFLSEDRFAQKMAVTRSPGARHAAVRFVAGALDRVDNRERFLDLARRADVPILAVYGAETPPKSLAEMRALAGLDTVEAVELPMGKLSVYEEFAARVVPEVTRFLTR